jgi:hypothetical protein
MIAGGREIDKEYYIFNSILLEKDVWHLFLNYFGKKYFDMYQNVM